MAIAGAPVPRAGSSQPTPSSGRTRSFLEDVTVGYGPAPLIGRLFLAADTECRERGVTMSVGTFEELVETNERNRDNWKPLFPSYHPSYQRLTPDNAQVLLGRDATGRIVATHAAILHDLGDQNLHDYAVDLRLNYADPEHMKLEGEQVVADAAPSMKEMRGRIAYVGAVWAHPDMRGRGITELIPRVARLWSMTVFKPDWTVAWLAEKMIGRDWVRRSGFANAETWIELKNTRMGSLRVASCWSANDDIIADAEDWMRDYDARRSAADVAVEPGRRA